MFPALNGLLHVVVTPFTGNIYQELAMPSTVLSILTFFLEI